MRGQASYPVKIRMIPPVVYHFESKAEEKLFQQFSSVEVDDDVVVLHSLNLPEHEYKQWAEADFVVVSARGILVLEVKGGRVSCNNGIWVFTNRFGNEFKKSEGPYQQAMGARIALQSRLDRSLPSSLIGKINFGFGVMFPDHNFNISSVEIPEQAIYDAKNWENGDLARWLKRLYKFWAGETHKSARLNEKEVKTICHAMRPSLDLVPALISRVGECYQKLVKLTDEQCKYLDILLVQERVVIEGGAGTGKTFLAVEAARRLAAEGKKVLFVCRSHIFSWIIQERVHNSFVDVMNMDAVIEAIERGTPIDFDVLIVDEGQDFLDIDSIMQLDGLFADGLEKGKWLFFMDRNNQGSMYEKYDEAAMEYLRHAGIPFPLKQNCRNTKQIAIQTMLYTGGDIGRCSIEGSGLPVDDNNSYSSREELITIIDNVLRRWIDEEGITPGHITVLSPLPFEESVAASLDKRWRRKFFKIDSSIGNQWHDSMLTFSTVRDFKGLENRYIMLVDLEGFSESNKDLSMLYVAMTRANSYLWMAVPEQAKKIMDTLRGRHAEQLAEMLAKEGQS